MYKRIIALLMAFFAFAAITGCSSEPTGPDCNERILTLHYPFGGSQEVTVKPVVTGSVAHFGVEVLDNKASDHRTFFGGSEAPDTIAVGQYDNDAAESGQTPSGQNIGRAEILLADSPVELDGAIEAGEARVSDVRKHDGC